MSIRLTEQEINDIGRFRPEWIKRHMRYNERISDAQILKILKAVEALENPYPEIPDASTGHTLGQRVGFESCRKLVLGLLK